MGVARVAPNSPGTGGARAERRAVENRSAVVRTTTSGRRRSARSRGSKRCITDGCCHVGYRDGAPLSKAIEGLANLGHCLLRALHWR